jgi:hypothetical protein
LRPAQANSSQDLISKITRAKWTRGVAHAVECLLWKFKALNSNPGPTGKKKERKEGRQGERAREKKKRKKENHRS